MLFWFEILFLCLHLLYKFLVFHLQNITVQKGRVLIAFWSWHLHKQIMTLNMRLKLFFMVLPSTRLLVNFISHLIIRYEGFMCEMYLALPFIWQTCCFSFQNFCNNSLRVNHPTILEELWEAFSPKKTEVSQMSSETNCWRYRIRWYPKGNFVEKIHPFIL